MLGIESKLFCTSCGNLLDFKYDINNNLTCGNCKSNNNFLLNTESKEKNNTSYYNSLTWKKKLYNEIDKFRIFKEGANKIVVEQDCPMCDSKELLQYAMQQRSADEGSTVYSECPKCGYKCTFNN